MKRSALSIPARPLVIARQELRLADARMAELLRAGDPGRPGAAHVAAARSAVEAAIASVSNALRLCYVAREEAEIEQCPTTP